MTAPQISIIMPVYNTGSYLREAVDSVLGQQTADGHTLPCFELLVVDDGSSDPCTLQILANLADQPQVRVLRNARSKGAAGARNTGILAAEGSWIGFLDSDDLWFPHALARRWQVVCDQPGARWIGARFKLLRPTANAAGRPQFASPATLLGRATPQIPPAVRRMVQPVAAFAAECLIGIMSVLIRKELIVQQGLFDERLPRSEDYHLWFKCAHGEDLWLLDEEIAWYRIHSASLTHGDAPRFLHEESMLEMMLHDSHWRAYRALLLGRLDLVMQDHCYFYRSRRRFRQAQSCALYWLRRRPFQAAAWKELLAGELHRA